MELSFTLEYYGWLDIEVTDETGHYLIPASFLTDVICEIIQNVSSLIEGTSETIIVIQTEPNESRIRIQRGDAVCTFEILEFDDNFCLDEIDKGICVFKTQINIKDLAEEFWTGINKLRDLGQVEYKYRWGYDFPEEEYKRFEIGWKSLE